MDLKYLIIIILFPLCFIGQSQNLTDSINVIKLIKDGEEESDSITQLKKFEKVLRLSKENRFNYGIFLSHKKIADWKKKKYNTDSTIAQYKKGIRDISNSSAYNYQLNELIGKEFQNNAKYDSALFYFNKCVKFSNRKDYIGNSYMLIGNMWYQKYDYSNAFKSYITADSIFENDPKFKISKQRAQINNYLGFCVRTTHGYESAMEYYIVSKQLQKELGNELGVQEVNIAIAQAEISFNNYDVALELLNESIDFHEKNATNINSYSYGIIVRGFLLVKMEEFKKAEKDYKLYYDLAVKSKNKTYQRRGLAYLGDFYANSNQFQKSIEYYKEAIEQCKEVDDFDKELETTKSLIEVYKKNNDLQLALDAYDNYNGIQKKIDKKQITKKTFELEAKYQTEKKEQEIALLKSEKELTAQKQKSQRNLLIGGLGITSIAGLFLFVLFRNRQKTNAKLRELDTIKSNFFANISHEFRTPLTLISSPIDDILEDEAISDKKRQQFTVAKRNSDRLLSLVNQLLDLSKIDAGQLKLHIQKGNVLQFISALSDSFSYQANEKQIQYTVDVKHKDDPVYYDKDAVEKITVNLLSNAIKYTPEHGKIICDAYTDQGKLVIGVKNTGKGLSKEELKQIFQRFYQTSEENNGTGIGLALVKELVELHKGAITVDSERNGWTTFKVTLPVDKQAFKNEQFVDASSKLINEQPNTSSTPIPTNQDINDFEDSELPILLIVEDNADLRGLLTQTFANNYNVITANDGEKGIDLAIEHIPDIIISDIMMPNKNGIELTETLKNDERTSHIPIVLLTAKAGDANELKGIEVGADDYITKPFNSKILKTKVLKLIETRRLLQKRYSQELILLPKDIAITNLDEKFLEKVQNVLEKNLIESSFSVTDFSESVGMSRMQLHRKLKALTGLTASEFISSQRLKLAAQLLKTSDINISQVGYSVGFNDHSYFTKCFKKAYNCTPTEFANRS